MASRSKEKTAVRRENAVLHQALYALAFAVHSHFSCAVRADCDGQIHAHVGQRIGHALHFHAHAVPCAQIFLGNGGGLRGFGFRFGLGFRFGFRLRFSIEES